MRASRASRLARGQRCAIGASFFPEKSFFNVFGPYTEHWCCVRVRFWGLLVRARRATRHRTRVESRVSRVARRRASARLGALRVAA
eukprot:5974533-Prymnesium_polylepis.1